MALQFLSPVDHANLKVATLPSPSSNGDAATKLYVDTYRNVVPQAASITARNALSVITGSVVYRTDLNTYEEYTGSRWNQVGTAVCSTLSGIQGIDSMLDGSLAYNQADGLLYHYSTSAIRWKWVAPYITYLNATTSFTSTTTYVTLLSSPSTLQASGAVYSFELTLGIVAVTTVGLRVQLISNNGGTVNTSAEGWAAAQNSYWNTYLTAQSTPVALGLYGGGSTASTSVFRAVGTFTPTSANANLVVQATAGSSSATAVYALVGSMLVMNELV